MTDLLDPLDPLDPIDPLVLDTLQRCAQRGEPRGADAVLRAARQARDLDRRYATGLDLLEALPRRAITVPGPRSEHPRTSRQRANDAFLGGVAVIVGSLFIASIAVLFRTIDDPRPLMAPVVADLARDAVNNQTSSEMQAFADHSVDWIRLDPANGRNAGPPRQLTDPTNLWARVAPSPAWHAFTVPMATYFGFTVYPVPEPAPEVVPVGRVFWDVGFLPAGVVDAPDFDILPYYEIAWGCTPSSPTLLPPTSSIADTPPVADPSLCVLFRDEFRRQQAAFAAKGITG